MTHIFKGSMNVIALIGCDLASKAYKGITTMKNLIPKESYFILMSLPE